MSRDLDTRFEVANTANAQLSIRRPRTEIALVITRQRSCGSLTCVSYYRLGGALISPRGGRLCASGLSLPTHGLSTCLPLAAHSWSLSGTRHWLTSSGRRLYTAPLLLWIRLTVHNNWNLMTNSRNHNVIIW